MSGEGFIPPHGGYRDSKSYQAAEIVFDATVAFCKRFISPRDRTYDQMVQAARSGKQNIAEGSVASGTSKESEIKLTNVARASQEELMLDYEDFLRGRGLTPWDKDDPRAVAVRRHAWDEDRTYATYRTYVEEGTPEEAANTVLCLIHQTCYLLDRQIEQLEKDFLKNGGLRERMTRARLAARDGADAAPQPAPPACPDCGKPMRRRTARTGPHAGKPFWGCTGYPDCRGIRRIDE